MSVIIYPSKLKKGDTMATTAVSAPANADKIDLAITNLKELGLEVLETKNVRNDDGCFVSSSGRERAEELIELYRDTDIKYILASRGGEFLMEMLPYLDEHRDVIKNNPKWFQGFSDPSLLNMYITTNFNIATINGENISEFAMENRFKSIQDNIDFLFSENEEYVQESWDKYQLEEYPEGNIKGYNLTEDNIYVCDKGNCEFSGRLIGGCLDVFHLLAGTKYDNVANFVSQFEEDGVIWYFDDCEMENPEVYRRLWSMAELGYFKNVRGFLIGRSRVQRNDSEYFSFRDAIYRALAKYEVPIVFNVDTGHVPPQMYFVNGSLATFEYKDGKGKLTQKMI